MAEAENGVTRILGGWEMGEQVARQTVAGLRIPAQNVETAVSAIMGILQWAEVLDSLGVATQLGFTVGCSKAKEGE